MNLATTKRARAVQVEKILSEYDDKFEIIDLFRTQLLAALEGSKELQGLVHSIRSRPKDREHLREKLYRKMAKDGEDFDVNPSNLLEKINDLAGIRILHLHTRQITEINTALSKIFSEQQYQIIEEAIARTWDDESREVFRACGIKTTDSPSMYTSVHYVIGSASRTTVTCEIQVRTLMEEVWGEVDHAVNYPEPNVNRACRDELRVLARLTSSATRLVDAIFVASAEDS